jgi:CheY-like chemotaxis protein
MGGKMKVTSQEGKGSIFSFEIRVSLATQVESQPQKPRCRVIGLAPDQPNYRILIVEDKWNNRQLLLQLLEPLGFEVKEAANGQEAIKVWQEWQPHLIWMDMRMPVMDGYEATKRIKATTKGHETVIVALTASVFEEDRAMLLSAGCDDFALKPFLTADLFDKMSKHLGVRYIYEEEADMTKKALSKNEQEALTVSQLANLPAEWLNQLYHAALRAEDDLIYELLKEIESSHQTLTEALANLVNDFRFDKLVALTQP